MIKIEVTGNSIGEVADKLLAIGGSLHGAAGAAPAPAAEKPRKAKKVDPVMPEVAEMAAAPEPASEADTSTSEVSETTEQLSSQPTETTPPASASELDFDTDVAPVVLQVVKDKGKPVAEEILSQFGVAKASQLDPVQWPELVATLKAAL